MILIVQNFHYIILSMYCNILSLNIESMNYCELLGSSFSFSWLWWCFPPALQIFAETSSTTKSFRVHSNLWFGWKVIWVSSSEINTPQAVQNDMRRRDIEMESHLFLTSYLLDIGFNWDCFFTSNTLKWVCKMDQTSWIDRLLANMRNT